MKCKTNLKPFACHLPKCPSRTYIYSATLLTFIMLFTNVSNALRYEAESAALSADLERVNDTTASALEAVKMGDSGNLTWTISNVPSSATYTVHFGFFSPYGNKNQTLYLNGTHWGQLSFHHTDNYDELSIDLPLNAGTNTLNVVKNWGWMWFDYIDIPNIGNADPELSSITLTPESANISEGESIVLHANTLDQFGNTYLTDISWTVSGAGKLSNTTGASTTFSSEGSLGNFTVTATAENLTRYAIIAVDADHGSSILEAENASFDGPARVNDGTASGGAFLAMGESGSITWEVIAPETKSYELTIGYRSPYGNKRQRLNVNNNDLGEYDFSQSANWTETRIAIHLNAGANTFSINKSWGWVDFDYLSLPEPTDPADLLRSAYFAEDGAAHAVARGEATVTMPTVSYDGFDNLQWRVGNALRMLGYEPKGIFDGATIDKNRLIEIDAELAVQEQEFENSAARLSGWESLFAIDFLENVPQMFAVHQYVNILDLFNAGETNYQSVTTECLIANMIPVMCGAFVDSATIGNGNCKHASATLLEELTIQSPELFGFNNIRREILQDEYPTTSGVPTTLGYVSTLIHEFVHDLDSRWQFSSTFIRPVDRLDVCSANNVNFRLSGNPFTFSGVAGAQDIRDYVSRYAAGLSNAAQDYRSWEDVAESVTAYILYPEFFRYRMNSSTRLHAKYEYIRDIMFGGVEFSNPHTAPFAESLPVENTISTYGSRRIIPSFKISDIITLP